MCLAGRCFAVVKSWCHTRERMTVVPHSVISSKCVLIPPWLNIANLFGWSNFKTLADHLTVSVTWLWQKYNASKLCHTTMMSYWCFTSLAHIKWVQLNYSSLKIIYPNTSLDPPLCTFVQTQHVYVLRNTLVSRNIGVSCASQKLVETLFLNLRHSSPQIRYWRDILGVQCLVSWRI